MKRRASASAEKNSSLLDGPMPTDVLIIEDEESVAWALRKACERQGYGVRVVATAEDGLKQAKTTPPNAVFLDVRLPGMDGLTALNQLRQLAPDAAVVVITAHGNLDTAVQAVARGAFDYLAKPFDLDQALDAVRRALTRNQPNGTSTQPQTFTEELIGKSPAMQTVFKRIALVAPTDAGVLITGESGTGKELVARAIHQHSARRNKAFLPVHIAAMNPNLVESELFGHVRGAFTGADRAHPGLLTLADGGTVFLDELADIPLPVQAKLLRVLERQEVFPVGGTTPQKVNVRLISATHADLSQALDAGTFRHDLFFRLNVYPIQLPSLRDRPEDFPLLIEHFLQRFSTSGRRPNLPESTLKFLQQRPWPGNVRELRNALEHAAIESRGGELLPEHFPPLRKSTNKPNLQEKLNSAVREWLREQLTQNEPNELYDKMLTAVEPTLLKDTLEHVQGNRQEAARILGLARATLRKLIRKHQLEDDGDEDGD
jgi:two-component system, NtrC family, nitrogen regulation response regulator GlnG